MKDEKNIKNESTPFDNDPFSVDVWERAYKNVGRPFEKMPFNNTANESQNKTYISPNSISLEPKRDISSQSTNKSNEKHISSPARKPSVDLPSYKATPNIRPSTTEQSYVQKAEITTKTTNIDSKSDEPENVFEMVKNVFGGLFSDGIGEIKKLFGSEDMDEKGVTNIIWVVIAIIFLAIVGLLGGL